MLPPGQYMGGSFLNKQFLIQEWAVVRRGELVAVPDRLDIHPDFLISLPRESLAAAFRQVWEMDYQMLTDISEDPAHFGMPLVEASEIAYGAPMAQESRYAAWRPMKLLNLLLRNGTLEDGRLTFNPDALKKESKLKGTSKLLPVLSDFGFVLEGHRPLKAPFSVSYPDNPDVMTVLDLMARKADSIRRDVLAPPGRRDYFCEWNYRLLLEGFGTCSYDTEYYLLYDKMHSPRDREFVAAFHDFLLAKGLTPGNGGWNEGPGIRYYESASIRDRKGPYLFQMASWKGELQLSLRIRNAARCLPYVESCSDSIREMFRDSMPGCANRDNGCKSGVRYIYEGQERWKCGCCGAPFSTRPRTADIPQYWDLVELGVKR